jgi:8-oxo-dGTP pyrophosphatase MutT (NUDIX family)
VERMERKSVRGLLVTPERELLLIKIENPDGNWVGWITPGGGLDPDESEESALRRELYEELGLENFTIAGRVWKRFHRFPWKGRLVAQREIFFLIESERFIPTPKVDTEHTEMLDFKEFRWWGLEELRTSNEVFAPRRLYEYLCLVLRGGVPIVPFEAEE